MGNDRSHRPNILLRRKRCKLSEKPVRGAWPLVVRGVYCSANCSRMARFLNTLVQNRDICSLIFGGDI